jgi:hypothetical protein
MATYDVDKTLIWKEISVFCACEILTSCLFYRHLTVVLTVSEYKYVHTGKVMQ